MPHFSKKMCRFLMAVSNQQLGRCYELVEGAEAEAQATFVLCIQ